MGKHILAQDKIISEKDYSKLLRETGLELEKTLTLYKSKLATDDKVRLAINDHFIIMIVANTGLRISELARLRWSDIHEDYLVVQNGKGDKKRHVYFGDRCKEALDVFKNLVNPKEDSYLYIGKRGPLTDAGIHQRVKLLVERYRLSPTYSTHSFRHRYATYLLSRGVGLHAVRDMLGHADISTTNIYLHFTEEEKVKIKLAS